MRILRLTTTGFISILLFTLSFTHPVQALPGDLDPGFSSDGVVTTKLGDRSTEQVHDVAIQADGKIVVAGTSNVDGLPDFALARYKSNGTLDTSFSSNGIVITDFGSLDTALAVAIQPDSKIVAAGFLIVGETARGDFALARYNPDDGSLDTSFGNGGKVTTNFPIARDDRATAIALQPDGKIVVAGTSSGDFALARYNPIGTPDLDFSADGKLTTDFGSDSADSAVAVVLQPDGKIVVAGRSDVNGTNDFALARYNSDGSLDDGTANDITPGDSFGTGGKVTTDTRTTIGTSGDDRISDIALQPDGKIVVAGSTDLGSCCPLSFFSWLRYNSDGSLDSVEDTSFSSDSSAVARAIAIQADGKIVVAGHSDADGDFDFALARFNSDGNLDNTFSNDGKVLSDVSGDNFDEIRAIAIQKNGKIVVAGFARDPSTAFHAFALARYQAFECGGKDVTILGTNGPDTLNGISFVFVRDVIHGLGGDDTINGGAGDDSICGGAGNDTLNGGDNNDTLFGEGDNDTLDGSKGTDTCVGGGQAGDTFKNCETINTGKAGLSGAWVEIAQQCNDSQRNMKCQLKGTLVVENPRTETTAVPSLLAFFLSEDAIWDENDTRLKDVEVDALEGGKSQEVKLHVKLEEGQNVAGQFVIAVLDILNVVPELNEDNNIVVSFPLQ